MIMTIGVEDEGARRAHTVRRQWEVGRRGIDRDRRAEALGEEVVAGAEEVGAVGMDIGHDHIRGRGVDRRVEAPQDRRTVDHCRGHRRHEGDMDGEVRHQDGVVVGEQVEEAVEAEGEVRATAHMGAGVREIGV